MITFYPDISKDIVDKYLEKLLRINFIVEESGKLLNVKMICTPAIYLSEDGKMIHKYNYVNNDLHMFGLNNMNEDESEITHPEASFINSTSSSDCSQVIVLSSKIGNIMNEFLEDYFTYSCNNIIFTIQFLKLCSP